MKLCTSTWQYTADIFLRLMGVVYLMAIYSLWTQIDGLIGEQGILPAGNYFKLAASHLGPGAWMDLPSLLWLFNNNAALNALCITGMLLSIALVFGLAPLFCTFALWIVYLSLTVGGQTFFAFQWDNLLLEAGCLAVLLSPPVWRSRPSSNPRISRMAIFLLHWLLFRLMFASGYVKLASQDESWWNLTALNYHFWTQPLPVWISWYAHHLPLWILKAATAIMFFIELVVPFFIFGGRTLRMIAFGLLLLLQVAILATGNYGFFNILTIALCIPLLDDRVFRGKREIQFSTSDPRIRNVMNLFRWPVFLVILLVSTVLTVSIFKRDIAWPSPVISTMKAVMPFRSINNYGLFAAMTKSRPEIIIEGSRDGLNWIAYEFNYKPGDMYRTPLFALPHMPRLDWQMWFAALGNYQGNPWLTNFMARLLEGQPDVLDLLEKNPFKDEPPRLIRAIHYDYTFATPEQNEKHFLWWNRELKGLYCPILSRNP